MAVVAVIQARTGSTRLRGKVLHYVAGLPLLAHVVARTQAMSGLDRVVVATSTSPADDAIQELSRTQGWPCFRGSEADVLARYVGAAQAFGADHILRVTSDCPFVCPVEGQRVIEHHLSSAADLTHNVTAWGSGMPLGTGIELISANTLYQSEARGRAPRHREHVDEWAFDNRHELRFDCVTASSAVHRPELRLTVDTPDDLKLVRAIHEELRQPPAEIALADVVALLDCRPEMRMMNAHVRQKSVLL